MAMRGPGASARATAVARHTVEHEQREQHHRRVARDDDEQHHHPEQRQERHAALEVDVLEAVERRVRHHRDAGIQREHPGGPGDVGRRGGDPLGLAQVGHDPDQPGHQRGGRGTGQTLEVALVDHPEVGVEASQPQCRARAVDERREPAPLAEAAQRPLVHDQRRRGAERHHVREAVVLLAEGALGVGQTCHSPVQAVEHHRDEDRDRGDLEPPVHRLDDRVEAAEQRRRRERVGQDVDAAHAAPRHRDLFFIGRIGRLPLVAQPADAAEPGPALLVHPPLSRRSRRARSRSP